MTKVDWHPFPEEKPNKECHYLVTIPLGDSASAVLMAYWDSKRWLKPMRENPIGWAELPEPYQPPTDPE